jgi:hypothetical protein
MKDIFKLKSFWIIAFLASALISVALINFNRIFVSETSVLIVPKSQLAILGNDQIVENLSHFANSLSFGEKISAIRPDLVPESVEELPAHKKKKYWSEKIEAERVGDSGIIVILAKDKSRYVSESLSAESARELINFAALYYNVKADLDVRVLDEPATKEALSQNQFFLFLESFLIGFFLTFLSFSLSFHLFPKEEKISKKSFDYSSWTPKKTEKKDLESVIFKEEPWVPQGRTASAPSNLPIAPTPTEEEDTSEKIEKEKKEEKPKSDQEPIIREATPEEVKERLNKLLSGKM